MEHLRVFLFFGIIKAFLGSDTPCFLSFSSKKVLYSRGIIVLRYSLILTQGWLGYISKFVSGFLGRNRIIILLHREKVSAKAGGAVKQFRI